MTSVTLTLAWPPRELSPNYHGKLRLKMRAKKAYREDCWARALEAGIRVSGGDGLIGIRFTFRPPDLRSRDDDNLVGRMKVGRDSIARVLGVDDKTFRTAAPVIGAADPAKAGFVEVELFSWTGEGV